MTPHVPPSPLSIKVVNSSTNSYLRKTKIAEVARPRGSGWPTRAHQDIWWTVTFFTFWNPTEIGRNNFTLFFSYAKNVSAKHKKLFLIFQKKKIKIAGNWSAVWPFIFVPAAAICTNNYVNNNICFDFFSLSFLSVKLHRFTR